MLLFPVAPDFYQAIGFLLFMNLPLLFSRFFFTKRREDPKNRSSKYVSFHHFSIRIYCLLMVLKKTTPIRLAANLPLLDQGGAVLPQ